MNMAATRTSTLAVISLVSGILCWIAVPFIGALVAVICGHSARGEIRRAGKIVGHLKLSVAGQHNLFNATMAVAACAACGIDPAPARPRQWTGDV